MPRGVLLLLLLFTYISLTSLKIVAGKKKTKNRNSFVINGICLNLSIRQSNCHKLDKACVGNFSSFEEKNLNACSKRSCTQICSQQSEP